MESRGAFRGEAAGFVIPRLFGESIPPSPASLVGYSVGNPLPSLLWTAQWRCPNLRSFQLNKRDKNLSLFSAYLSRKVLEEPEQKEGAPRAQITKLPRHQGFPPGTLPGKKSCFVGLFFFSKSLFSSCKFAKQEPGCGPGGIFNLNKAALMISGDGQGILGIS